MTVRPARVLDDGSVVLAPRVVSAFARMTRAQLDRWERDTGGRANPELREAQRVLERAELVRQLPHRASVDGSDSGSVSSGGSEGDLMDTAQAAALAGVTPRRIGQRAAAGQIPGARKIAGRWLIPSGFAS